MELDDDIYRIFSALDTHNQGFIDKNDFLTKMFQFLSNSNDFHDNNVAQIKQLMEPYSQLGFNEFKEIYLEIQRLNEISDKERNNFVNDDDICNSKHSDSPDSSGSSDIDDMKQKKRIWIRRSKMPNSQIESMDSTKSSPGSARKHGQELMNSSKEKFLKIINSPLTGNSVDHAESDTILLNNDMETKMENLSLTNEKLMEKILKLQQEIEEDKRRYQTQKEENKSLKEKIYLQENVIHENEQRYKDKVRTNTSECNNKLQSMENELSLSKYQFDERSAEMRKQLATVTNENKSLLLRCEASDAEAAELRRECRNLQARKGETETILMEYKQVASKQVTELQAERDQLELANMKLNTELQTVKHISPSKSPSKRSSLNETPVAIRYRAKSTIESTVKSESSHSSNSMNTEYQNGKLRPDSKDLESTRLVQILTMENRNLVERIAHLETVGFYQRQKLEAANCLSLAAEMEQLNVEELKKALTVERETVRNLQTYMESLTTKLLTAGHIDVFQLS